MLSGNRLLPAMYGRQVVDISNGTLSKDVTIVTANNNAGSFTPGSRIGLNDQLDFTIERNGALRFQQSDDETDAGQNFVPYFDANLATFDNVAAISGFGLIHYTTNARYAGYIRPVLTSSRINTFIF